MFARFETSEHKKTRIGSFIRACARVCVCVCSIETEEEMGERLELIGCKQTGVPGQEIHYFCPCVQASSHMSRHAPRSGNLTPILHHVVLPLLFPLPMPLGFFPLPSTSSHLYSFLDGNFPFSVALAISLFPSLSLSLLSPFSIPSLKNINFLPFSSMSSFRSSLPPYFFFKFPSFLRIVVALSVFFFILLSLVYTRRHTWTANLLFCFCSYDDVAPFLHAFLSTVYLWSLVMRNNRAESRGRSIGAVFREISKVPLRHWCVRIWQTFL